jgi:leader peptidase (prepilin peptidase)/N-methyltransferase
VSIFFCLEILVIFYIGFKICNAICKNLLIRIISAFSLVLLFYKFSFSLNFFVFALFVISLILVSVSDYYNRIIPMAIPPLLFSVGLLFSFFNPFLGEHCFFRLLNSIFGSIIGGGVLFLFGILGELLYKKEVMGGGDVKLMAGIGAFLGVKLVLLAILFASFLGGIVGFIVVLFKKGKLRETYIPFGPFLSLTSFTVLFVPQ